MKGHALGVTLWIVIAYLYLICIINAGAEKRVSVKNHAVKIKHKIATVRMPVVVKTRKKQKAANSNSKAASHLKKTQQRNYIVRCCGRKSCRNNISRKPSRNNLRGKNKTLARVAKIIRNDLNGPSHKLVAIGKQKYKFPPEKATFKDAQKLCAEQGLQVTSLSDKKEASKINEYVDYIGFGNEPMFTSMIPDVMNMGVTWGTQSPPGGPGSCLMQLDGTYYNASCDQSAHFSCEEKPMPKDMTTEGYDLLSSLGDAVLNFVGGRNIVAPSERASVPEATGMCESQGMELMNLNSLTQMSSVQNFLGDIGLSASTILTSMSSVSDGGSNWLGDLASALVPPKNKGGDGDCMGLSAVGLLGLSCDMVSNFVCQAPDPKIIDVNGEEMPFSPDLLNLADSMGIPSLQEDVVTKPVPFVGVKTSARTKENPTTVVAKEETEPPDTEAPPEPTDAPTIAAAVTEPAAPQTTSPEILTTVAKTSTAATSTTTASAPMTTTSPAVTTTVAVKTSTAPPSSSTSTSTSVVATTTATTTTQPPTTTTTQPPTTTKPAETTTTTTTTPAPIAMNFAAMGKNYTSPNISLPLEGASDWCKGKGMALATLETVKELDSILALIGPNTTHANTSYYTGMAKRTNFLATDLRLDLKIEEYFNATKDAECMALVNASTKSVACNESRGFICEQVKNFTHVNESSSGKYILPADLTLTFNEFVSFCKKRNVSVVQISDYFELVGELQQLIDLMNLTNTPVFVDLAKVNGTFLKESTKLLLNWETGHPKDNMDCAALSNRKLITVACSDVYPSICEKPASSAPPVTENNTVLDLINKEKYIVSAELIYPAYGKNFCEKNGLEFVAIESLPEHKALLDALKSAGLQDTAIAINLHKNQNVFEWGPGSVLNIASIGWTELPKTTSECGAYINGAITMTDCQKPTNIFCEEAKAYANYRVYNNSQNEPRYFWYPDKQLSHSDAKAYCEKSGYSLVVLDSPFEIERDIAPLNITDDMFISYEETGSSAESYKTSRFNNWLIYKNSNPNIFKTELCLTLHNGINVLPTDCRSPMSFLCENKTVIPAPSAVAVSWRDPGAANTGLTALKISASDTESSYYLGSNMDFYNARKKCQQFGIDLAIIETEDENGNIMSMLAEQAAVTDMIYIGLHRIGQAGPNFTHWINNVSLTYNAWNGGEPGIVEGEDCAFIQSSGGWMDYFCDKQVHFICEKNPAYEQLT